MRYLLKLAHISILLISERPLRIEPEWALFMTDQGVDPDLTVQISWEWDESELPQTPMLGQDMILNYHQQEDLHYCVSRHDAKGPISLVFYKPDLRDMVCKINEKPFIYPPDSVGRIMRLLPMREILLQHNVLLFHAAQIVYKNVGILFSAPSGTGKTTQTKLWEKYRNAEIVCNDRTLVRMGNYQTYGFPLDGSEPVRKNSVHNLGAIILLQQGEVNELYQLKKGRAASMLMQQLVMDCWNPISRERNMVLILNLLMDVPVYLFSCTPDEEAVEVLEKYLIENGVITNDKNY